jgi:hypothetical protein
MYRIRFHGCGGQGVKTAHPYVRAPPKANKRGACSFAVGTYLLYRPWPGDHCAVSAAHAQPVETVARRFRFRGLLSHKALGHI